MRHSFPSLAYAGLRPGEALGLRWGNVREQTLLIQRAISLGEESDPKTRQHRTVRLLAALAADRRSWRMAAGRPGDSELMFPGKEGRPCPHAAYQSWRRRAFNRAARAAGLAHARPYDLRHSFALLLMCEGRSVINVARELGHDPRLTLTRYGHVIDELEDRPRIEAEAAIADARLAVRTVDLSSCRSWVPERDEPTPVVELSGGSIRRLPPESGLC
jgi:integrase